MFAEQDVFATPYAPTLPKLLAWCVKAHGERPFLIEGALRLSYADAERESAKLAAGLLALGIGKGTRVGILMPNRADFVLVWLAAARIGALTLPLSTLFQPRELGDVLRQADIDTLITVDRYMGHEYLERLERAVPGLAAPRTTTSGGPMRFASHPYLRRIVVRSGEGGSRDWAAEVPDGSRFDRDFLAAVEEQVSPADLLLAICTSGTTAEPKIVMHTHATVTRPPWSYVPKLDLRRDDRNYSGMLFFWIGGFNVNLMPVICAGAAMVFAPTTDPDDVLDAMVAARVTRVSMWIVQRLALRERAKARGLDLSFVRQGLWDPTDAEGKPIPENRRVAGPMGMTENFGMHSVCRPDEILDPKHGGSFGRQMPGVERRVLDPETGREVEPGTVGELQLRGFSLMQGYYKRERADVFTPDGWFPTGDLVRLVDGYLFFHGRRNDMIKTSGANVSAREVEVQLERCPGVREAIVFGIPDPVRGEIVAAVLVPSDGQRVDVEAVRLRIKEELSSFKLPQRIEVAAYEAIPRTASGKPIKGRLLEALVSHPAAGSGA